MDGAITTKILEVKPVLMTGQKSLLYLLGLLQIQGKRKTLRNTCRKGLDLEIYSGSQRGVTSHPESIVPNLRFGVKSSEFGVLNKRSLNLLTDDLELKTEF